jgi:hypothetical protein
LRVAVQERPLLLWLEDSREEGQDNVASNSRNPIWSFYSSVTLRTWHHHWRLLSFDLLFERHVVVSSMAVIAVMVAKMKM